MRRARAAPAFPTEPLVPVASTATVTPPAATAPPRSAPLRLPRPDAGERIALALIAIGIAVELLLLWPAPLVPAFDGPWRHDPAIFAYEGALVRQGGMPYLAFWDHKGPLIYLINAAGLSISGGQIWGVWLVGLVAIWAAAAAAYLAMRESFGVAGGLAGLVFFVFALGGMETGTNMTEQYALPLAWGAVLVLVRWTRARRDLLGTGCALGMLGALAFFLRANLAGAAASAALAIAVVLINRRQRGALARMIAGGAIGALIIALPLIAWLARGGALRAFWDDAIAYNFLYSQSGWTQRAIALLAGVWLATVTAPIVLPLAGLVVSIRRLRRSLPDDRVRVVLLFMVIWTVLELSLASVSGRAYDHYFVMLIPPMAMLTAALVAELVALAPANVRRRARWSPMAAALLAVVMFRPLADRFVQRARTTGLVPSPASSQTVAAADFVRANSAPNDRLLVWGLAGGVYLLAERPPASRYLFASPLLTREYGDVIAPKFLTELRRRPPLLIVDAGEFDASAPSLARWNPTWRYPDMRWYAPHRVVTPALRPFYDFVAENYRAVAIVGPERWTIYRINKRMVVGAP
jgi:4-amino-4-deoxy-L-arabinose transferase-like glycosyltransferase